MATRQPAGMPAKHTAVVQREAQAEKARKAESRAALKAARDAEKAAKAEQKQAEQAEQAEQKQAEQAEQADALAAKAAARDADRAAFLEALRADAITMHGGSATDAQIAEYVRDQGVDPVTGDALIAKTPYSGPMIALKTARQHYQKAANGVQCNGDKLATLCGRYSRADTVAALINALGLPSNPYSHLNPGQQSMNLRNKARHAVNEGRLALAQIQAAYDANGAKPV